MADVVIYLRVAVQAPEGTDPAGVRDAVDETLTAEQDARPDAPMADWLIEVDLAAKP